MEKNKKSALEVISNLNKRPSSEEALDLKDEEILSAAEALGFPLNADTRTQILNIHGKVLPLVESKLATLLGNEVTHPDYYPLARDGELIYDALWGLGQANGSTLVERTHFTKTSVGMTEKRVDPEYFFGIGITEERLQKGPPIILVDSGFLGTLFRQIARWTKISGTIPNASFRGYLISNAGGMFNSLPFSRKISPTEYDELVESMKSSPYERFSGGDLDRAICAFMQLMPKFTGRYTQTYLRQDGVWDVLPEQNLFAIEKNIGSSTNSICPSCWENQKNDSSYRPVWINADIVDPVTSLLLQRRTLKYFSNPDVHDRIYSGQIKPG
ncbi:hypothetical protein KA107_03050 [Candidatus Pacearchaeota archaeon]|nr:hypothetical protein [Candidatus Pacearchaeota archaeon]